MKKIQWNKVTWYSRLIAAILFIFVVPVWTFYLGKQYQKTKDILASIYSFEKRNR